MAGFSRNTKRDRGLERIKWRSSLGFCLFTLFSAHSIRHVYTPFFSLFQRLLSLFYLQVQTAVLLLLLLLIDWCSDTCTSQSLSWSNIRFVAFVLLYNKRRSSIASSPYTLSLSLFRRSVTATSSSRRRCDVFNLVLATSSLDVIVYLLTWSVYVKCWLHITLALRFRADYTSRYCVTTFNTHGDINKIECIWCVLCLSSKYF